MASQISFHDHVHPLILHYGIINGEVCRATASFPEAKQRGQRESITPRRLRAPAPAPGTLPVLARPVAKHYRVGIHFRKPSFGKDDVLRLQLWRLWAKWIRTNEVRNYKHMTTDHRTYLNKNKHIIAATSSEINRYQEHFLVKTSETNRHMAHTKDLNCKALAPNQQSFWTKWQSNSQNDSSEQHVGVVGGRRRFLVPVRLLAALSHSHGGREAHGRRDACGRWRRAARMPRRQRHAGLQKAGACAGKSAARLTAIGGAQGRGAKEGALSPGEAARATTPDALLR
ncbi:hypothetical protein MSG28_003407 [Choristoneura fumiferana]|uniref:Uncharacterized protein n=1 Tax=Choristoneura fumiferana TaxID=7141 RepID=A0ACC0KFD1_CHOFU|nr:hypothetical protein MSG28_003407 [Choristoneura fumiferana]